MSLRARLRAAETVITPAAEPRAAEPRAVVFLDTVGWLTPLDDGVPGDGEHPAEPLDAEGHE